MFSRVHSELSALRSAGCDVTMGATPPALSLSLSVPAALHIEMRGAPGDQLRHMTGDTAAHGGFTLLMALGARGAFGPT